MSLVVIAIFLFFPLLLIAGLQWTVESLFGFALCRKIYLYGIFCASVGLFTALQVVLNGWANENSPDYTRPISYTLFPAVVLPVVCAFVGGRLLKLQISRKAFFVGYGAGLAGTACTIYMFYWYFTG